MHLLAGLICMGIFLLALAGMDGGRGPTAEQNTKDGVIFLVLGGVVFAGLLVIVTAALAGPGAGLGVAAGVLGLGALLATMNSSPPPKQRAAPPPPVKPPVKPLDFTADIDREYRQNDYARLMADLRVWSVICAHDISPARTGSGSWRRDRPPISREQRRSGQDPDGLDRDDPDDHLDVDD